MNADQPVVIAAGRRDDALADVWSALLREARHGDEPEGPAHAPHATPMPSSAPRAVEVRGVRNAVRRARGFLDAGFHQLVIVPQPAPGASDRAWGPDELGEAVDGLRQAYPRATIRYAGAAMDPDAAEVLGTLVATPQRVSEALLAGAIARGFDGEPARVASFVAVLKAALPPNAVIGLRGSTVMGRAFRDGAPFDAGGPGSSDLDVVVVGDGVADLWVPEARLLGGINTLPLGDDAPWVAPTLDARRREAQALAGRPLSIQAMAQWYLDLRVAIQGQAYVVLAAPS